MALLRTQLADTKRAYSTLNEAYAKTLRSTITDEISGLDTEGDQLYMAVKQTAEGAQKMTFNQQKVQAGNRYVELLKKYRVDVKENMISEWSKIQQLCEEVDGNAALQLSAERLGITDAIARLATIADTIRTKITQRSAELPEAQQMKKARQAMDPEYKALVQVLNASAIIYGQHTATFDEIIRTLNQNIDYVKIHAMSKTSDGGDEPSDDSQEDGGGSSDVTPAQPENPGGGSDEPAGDDH